MSNEIIKKNQIMFSCHKFKPGNLYVSSIDTFNKLGYKAKINTHTTSYIN